MNENDLEKLQQLEKAYHDAVNGLAELEHTHVSIAMRTCNKHGEFKEFHCTMQFGEHIIQKRRTQCPHCLADEITALKNKIVEQEKERQAMRIARLKASSGIPPRFEQASFTSYQENNFNRQAKRLCAAYAEKWLERQAVGGGLILCGKPGTGKSHLACAIANQVIEQHQADVFITSALRIMRKVKSTWERNAEMRETDVLQHYISKDLLIIDEVGVQFGSESEKIILFEIINERYEQMKPTILISNLPEDKLEAYVTDRVIDRLKDGKGALVNFDWESFRK